MPCPSLAARRGALARLVRLASRLCFSPGATLPLVALLSTGCQATLSGKAQGGASLSGGTQGGASASASASATGGARAGVQAGEPAVIVFKNGKLEYSGTINFAYNEARLEGAETVEVLGHLRDFLDQHREVKVRIEGHTDSRGTPSYNKELSGRRAAAIRRWLVDHQIAEGRMTSAGLGEDQSQQHEDPRCYNLVPRDTSLCESGWAVSRRAVFSVTEGAETLRVDPPPAKEAPAPTSVATELPPERERVRRWLLGAHLGAEAPVGDLVEGYPVSNLFSAVVPLGIDGGIWISPRFALGLSLEAAPGVMTGTCLSTSCDPSGLRTRAELWAELHSSTGPSPELWAGAGLGFVGLIFRGDGNTADVSKRGPGFALRAGVDFHASEAVRIGPFLEAMAVRLPAATDSQDVPAPLRGSDSTHGWLGGGLRIGFDFFRAE